MPRIMLIHAVAEAVVPIRQAFAADWPAAETHDLMDTSLSADLAAGAGKPEEHDALLVQAARALPPVDAIVIGQFSAARAAAAIAAVRSEPVLTTPGSAVTKLKATLGV